ncbi:N-myc proto-oncogene protein-like [Macrobrachium nipponense]|uniref:N-myc proto-oncogene protein-like n=1 Tax=Macrobrachium nipponense TaxID=159736 RepID=UPI0030C8B2C3
MAMWVTAPDMMSDQCLSPTQLQHHAVPDDIWNKFDIESDKALVLSNQEALPDSSTNLMFTPEMGYVSSNNVISSNAAHYHLGVPPTPPHSPPTEHDLDELVAVIPEILESPSATPPSDISDILSDLESTPLTDSSLEVSWGSNCFSWWPPVVAPAPSESLKRDIMWGGGTCCPSLLEVPKKERQVSECSADAALREALRPDEVASDDEDSEDNMPDTPSGTDSDGDVDDHNSNSWPRSTNSAARYGNIVVFRGLVESSSAQLAPSVNSEHNYCGRVPEPDGNVIPGIVTPSDTEDEVDVVSCNDQSDIIKTAFNINTACPTMPTATASSSSSPGTARHQDQSKISADVKRQLQARIHAMRNRQNNKVGLVPNEADEATNSRFVSVKIKTQGKPAAYTKRMRDYHSEVMKTTKHRRRNRGESDEGRRSVHNSLERQRRVDLRNAFEYLRLLVPETKDLEKAPKVQILKKAALHCKQLQVTEQRLMREKEKLRKQLEYLQQRRTLCS